MDREPIDSTKNQLHGYSDDVDQRYCRPPNISSAIILFPSVVIQYQQIMKTLLLQIFHSFIFSQQCDIVPHIASKSCCHTMKLRDIVPCQFPAPLSSATPFYQDIKASQIQMPLSSVNHSYCAAQMPRSVLPLCDAVNV